MRFNFVVGIDVSKLSLSVFLYQTKDYKEFPNSREGFTALLKWLSKQGCDLTQTLVCFEHTGLYSLLLAVFLTEENISFSMVSGLEVKRSLGIARGKSDEVDAEKIAEYAYLRKDKIKLYTLPSKSILCLKPLLSLRERMVSQKAGYQATLKENKRIFNEKENRVLFKTLDRLLVSLEEEIEKVEKEMLAIIKEDKELSRLYELVTSIKGVGLVLGITLLVYTNCFSSFDNWRKFACYSGVAPFEYKSGTSIKGKNKVSHLANKKIKALLTNAALSSIRHDPEMKSYYNNRVKKGKNSMSTINVVRNKILSRVFAVAKRGTAYVITHQYAA